MNEINMDNLKIFASRDDMLAHYGSASYGEPVVSYIESDGSVRMNKAPNVIRVLGDDSVLKTYSSGKYYNDRSFFVSQVGLIIPDDFWSSLIARFNELNPGSEVNDDYSGSEAAVAAMFGDLEGGGQNYADLYQELIGILAPPDVKDVFIVNDGYGLNQYDFSNNGNDDYDRIVVLGDFMTLHFDFGNSNVGKIILPEGLLSFDLSTHDNVVGELHVPSTVKSRLPSASKTIIRDGMKHVSFTYAPPVGLRYPESVISFRYNGSNASFPHRVGKVYVTDKTDGAGGSSVDLSGCKGIYFSENTLLYFDGVSNNSINMELVNDSEITCVTTDYPFNTSWLSSHADSQGLAKIGNCIVGYDHSKSSSLSSIVIDGSSVGESAFDKFNDVTSVSISNAQFVGENAFFNCQNLTSVTLSNCEYVGYEAFSNCNNLREVRISGVEYVPDECFLRYVNEDEDEITVAVHIGDGVKLLGTMLFAGSTVELHLETVEPPLGESGVFENTTVSAIYVPSSAVDTYKSHWFWQGYSDIIQSE